MQDHLLNLVETLGKTLLSQQRFVAIAESCTGGWLGQVMTSVSGSSRWFDRGFITYSHSAKQEMLAVPLALLEKYGAVSQEVAMAMATGVLQHSHADIAVAITGVAGPQGGTREKPVGLVWFGFAGKTINSTVVSQHFHGNRQRVRKQAVKFALEQLLNLLSNS